MVLWYQRRESLPHLIVSTTTKRSALSSRNPILSPHWLEAIDGWKEGATQPIRKRDGEAESADAKEERSQMCCFHGDLEMCIIFVTPHHTYMNANGQFTSNDVSRSYYTGYIPTFRAWILDWWASTFCRIEIVKPSHSGSAVFSFQTQMDIAAHFLPFVTHDAPIILSNYSPSHSSADNEDTHGDWAATQATDDRISS